MWAIILIVIVVLVAIYWFMTRRHEQEPAKTGMFDPPVQVEYALRAAPSRAGSMND
jgi:flagellar basal body-associated protein FliL